MVVTRFLLSLFRCQKWNVLAVAFVLLFTHSAMGDQKWSNWFNSDTPLHNEMDNETLSRISVVFGAPCSPSQVTAVECRQVGTDAVFSHQKLYSGNVLQVPCNKTGLVCRNMDQVFEETITVCADYEIRFFCDFASNKGSNSGNKNSLDYQNVRANGGYIALAAGGSVVIPLVCVLVVQLRKSKREERRRRELERQATEQSCSPEAAVDAPPAYEELFGDPQSVAVIANSTNMTPEPDDQRRGSSEMLVNNSTEQTHHADEGIVNLGSTALSSPSSSSLSSSSSSTSSSFLSVHRVTSSGTRRDSSESTLTTASSSSSTDALLPSTISGNRLTTASSSSSTDALLHSDPPPTYDWPGYQGSNHVTIVLPSEASSASQTQSTANSVSAPPLTPPTDRFAPRRFLGMHLSIFDLMAAVYPDPTPPPSYDDALKILGVPAQTVVQVR